MSHKSVQRFCNNDNERQQTKGIGTNARDRELQLTDGPLCFAGLDLHFFGYVVG